MPWLVGTALIHSLAVTKSAAVQELDRAFGDYRVFFESAGNISRAIWCADICSRIRHDPKRGIFILAFLTR